MKSQVLLILSSLLYFSCQANHPNVKPVSSKSINDEARAIISIDPFYNWGKYPKITLSAFDTNQLRIIIEPYSYKDPFPKNHSFSPPPMSSIEGGGTGYDIMADCEILGRKLNLDSKLKIYRILSKYTSYFNKPNS